ncbi:MAG TPA: 3-oxoacyl-ACP synthase [Bacteroidia bacterium]|nr:3-oxoacyl-ACP synthase [Bacteroidia bacterium]
MKNFISGYCIVRDSKINLNGKIIFEQDAELNSFLTNAYRKFNINYPKFFKMDLLCKLAFISSEILLKENNPVNKYKENETALVLSNHASSLDTDRNYFKTIEDKQNYFPSPSVFVYTLPNILIGEISIRNKITGENVFFISEKFNPGLLCLYTNMLFASGNTNCVLAGWMEVDKEKYDGFIYLVEKINPHPVTEHEKDRVSALYYKG